MKLKRIVKKHGKLFFFLKQGVIYARFLKGLIDKSSYKDTPTRDYIQRIEIAQPGFHCYFGYYDKSPINITGKMVVYLKVKTKNSQIEPAEICVFDMTTKEMRSVGKTNTWNWQQGSMEQWIDEDTISYNRYNAEKKTYQTARLNIVTGKETTTVRAAYYYNRDFTKYLSLNFHRLDKYAKGYGYPYSCDSFDYDKDGIWEVSVGENNDQLILTLENVISFEPKDYLHCQHYINHVAYCPDERYIIFIHRWQIAGGEFKSRLLKFDILNKQLTSLLDNGHVSHYCWKSKEELLIYATDKKGQKGYMIVNVNNGATRMLVGLPKEDGHPSYSNDRRWILTDSYPNRKREQFLFLFNVKEEKLYKLALLHSPLKYYNENRCDLHPRWSYDNKYVIVDNTDSGVRTLKIYEI